MRTPANDTARGTRARFLSENRGQSAILPFARRNQIPYVQNEHARLQNETKKKKKKRKKKKRKEKRVSRRGISLAGYE